MPRQRQRLTIILIPGAGRRTVSLHLAPVWLAAAGILATTAVIASVLLTYQNRSQRVDKTELVELRRLTGEQQANLAALAETAARADTLLKDLARLERQIHALTGTSRGVEDRTREEEGRLPEALAALFPDGASISAGDPTHFPSPANRGQLAHTSPVWAEGGAALRTELERHVREMARLQLRLQHGKQALAAELDYRARRPTGMPVGGATLTDRFGWRLDPFGAGRRFHKGLDFAQKTGTPVLATGTGVVTHAGWNENGLGNTVKVDHGYGFETIYAHLAAWTVAEGDVVSRGTPVGTVGSTGNSTGPHLHYEVHLHGEQVDPIRYLGEYRED